MAKETKELLMIDLDGTLIDTATGDTFPKTVCDVKFRHEVVIAVKNAIDILGLKFIAIVSNQGGVEAGFFTEEQINIKLQAIANMLSAAITENDTPKVTVLYSFCISNKSEDYNRKPNIGMAMQIIGTIENITKDKCQVGCNDILVVGDASGKPGDFSDSDKQFAINLGVDYQDVESFVEQYG